MRGFSLVEVLVSLVILAVAIAVIFGAVRFYRGNFLLSNSYSEATSKLENAYEIGRLVARKGNDPDVLSQADEMGISVSQVGTTSDGCEVYEISFTATLVSMETLKTLPSSFTTFYVVHCGE